MKLEQTFNERAIVPIPKAPKARLEGLKALVPQKTVEIM